MRLGLCCTFYQEPIRFRTTTARVLEHIALTERSEKLRTLAAHNARALHSAIEYCARHGIGCFRVNSQVLPLRTHPQFGYDSDLLGEPIVEAFRSCGRLAERMGIRLSFHPDQFVVLSSPEPSVVKNSLAEIEYQAEVAEWIGADVINVHGGGFYGDKSSALKRLVHSINRLSNRARSRLTIENDDTIYTPSNLLKICEQLNLPLVYDVHHHRCNSDGLDVEKVTALAVETWNREPLFHISSPRDGWRGKNPRRHSDYIDVRDFPHCWSHRTCTVEVEAKAKELAVLKLAKALKRRRR